MTRREFSASGGDLWLRSVLGRGESGSTFFWVLIILDLDSWLTLPILVTSQGCLTKIKASPYLLLYMCKPASCKCSQKCNVTGGIVAESVSDNDAWFKVVFKYFCTGYIVNVIPEQSEVLMYLS